MLELYLAMVSPILKKETFGHRLLSNNHLIEASDPA